ncbi:hypothetical protein HPB51_024507 [Rhipicephalus microplus]|uniref:Uncharacterized protein n=1 Tax=Rhipicephalus microplus TaxID=6941 RepID=A0A9J6DXR3_RHIMP|nr:hypothetical protein HPB51_024507 [Rhipicephalus microplus]
MLGILVRESQGHKNRKSSPERKAVVKSRRQTQRWEGPADAWVAWCRTRLTETSWRRFAHARPELQGRLVWPQAYASKLQEELAGRLIAYTGGSVIPDSGSATAPCVMPALGWTASCCLPFAACSTTSEMANLYLAVDLLAANPPTYVSRGCHMRLKSCVDGLAKAGMVRLRNADARHQTACPPCQWCRRFSALGPISCGNAGKWLTPLRKEHITSPFPCAIPWSPQTFRGSH